MHKILLMVVTALLVMLSGCNASSLNTDNPKLSPDKVSSDYYQVTSWDGPGRGEFVLKDPLVRQEEGNGKTGKVMDSSICFAQEDHFQLTIPNISEWESLYEIMPFCTIYKQADNLEDERFRYMIISGFDAMNEETSARVYVSYFPYVVENGPSMFYAVFYGVKPDNGEPGFLTKETMVSLVSGLAKDEESKRWLTMLALGQDRDGLSGLGIDWEDLKGSSCLSEIAQIGSVSYEFGRSVIQEENGTLTVALLIQLQDTSVLYKEDEAPAYVKTVWRGQTDFAYGNISEMVLAPAQRALYGSNSEVSVYAYTVDELDKGVFVNLIMSDGAGVTVKMDADGKALEFGYCIYPKGDTVEEVFTDAEKCLSRFEWKLPIPAFSSEDFVRMGKLSFIEDVTLDGKPYKCEGFIIHDTDTGRPALELYFSKK